MRLILAAAAYRLMLERASLNYPAHPSNMPWFEKIYRERIEPDRHGHDIVPDAPGWGSASTLLQSCIFRRNEGPGGAMGTVVGPLHGTASAAINAAHPSCCALRANGSKQESNTDYAEEAHRLH
jgi:hypothetical protein